MKLAKYNISKYKEKITIDLLLENSANENDCGLFRKRGDAGGKTDEEISATCCKDGREHQKGHKHDQESSSVEDSCEKFVSEQLVS